VVGPAAEAHSRDCLRLSANWALEARAMGVAISRHHTHRNLLGDLFNALKLGDLRTLIGIPIGGALIWYLVSPRTRAQFEVPSAAV
jgi:hypothetical protein